MSAEVEATPKPPAHVPDDAGLREAKLDAIGKWSKSTSRDGVFVKMAAFEDGWDACQRALLNPSGPIGKALADYKKVLADKCRLTRELDVAMHGEDGAAKQASLCDLIGPARDLRARAQAAETARREAEERARVAREDCAKIAERDVDWATFHCEGVANDLDLTEMTPTDRGILTYRAGIQAGRMIAAAIRASEPSREASEI